MSRAKVYIAYTGGTIGMRRGPDGYFPVPGFLATQMAAIPELCHASMPLYDIQEHCPLVDSANMTPGNWWRIAEDIAEHYDDYDGFVVLHGTDTMAFTASALSFLLEGLQKPVILTGSQIPLCELRTDARENLITSLLMAATLQIPEVCLYFGDKLLRGCRAVKVDAEGFDAFASPNLPPLATAGVEIDVERDLLVPQPKGPLRVPPQRPAHVAVLPIFPGISAELLERVLAPPTQGLVMEAYGVGNGPNNDPALLAVLQAASERGVVIVDRTRCLRGSVHLGDYATSSGLARAGAISATDMTLEATLTKLHVLLASGASPTEVRQQMQRNLRGELSRADDENGRRWRMKRILV